MMFVRVFCFALTCALILPGSGTTEVNEACKKRLEQCFQSKIPTNVNEVSNIDVNNITKEQFCRLALGLIECYRQSAPECSQDAPKFTKFLVSEVEKNCTNTVS